MNFVELVDWYLRLILVCLWLPSALLLIVIYWSLLFRQPWVN